MIAEPQQEQHQEPDTYAAKSQLAEDSQGRLVVWGVFVTSANSGRPITSRIYCTQAGADRWAHKIAARDCKLCAEVAPMTIRSDAWVG